MRATPYHTASITDDASYLSTRLRPEDYAEIRAGSGKDPLAVLMEGITYSDDCRTIMSGEDDTPLGMFGVAPVTSTEATIWLLCSPELSDYAMPFLRQAKAWVVAQPYTRLFNLTDTRNTMHHRWIKFLGFAFINTQAAGPYGLNFYEFERINPNV